MKVIVADKAGACYGVQRALDIARSTLDERTTTSTLGSLIHNPKVIDELESLGMTTARSIDDIRTDSVIIRSHGVTPQVKRSLDAHGFDIIDATCPHVLRAQMAAAELAREGYQVIVIGEAGHPEVEGLRAYAFDEDAVVHVVQHPADLPAALPKTVGIVVQTTQTRDSLNRITEALDARGVQYVLRDTICSATKRRQNAAAVLAEKVDAMVVIGGRNSSNTTRLAEICAAKCPRTIHIESADELDADFFDGVDTVGISAGASTPENQIDELVEHLRALEGRGRIVPAARIRNVEEDSPAYAAGFDAGCFITAVNGHPLRDILDWKWHAADDSLELAYIDLDGESGTITLERDAEFHGWGIEFDDIIFDGVKTCRNACKFCFMAQLPSGMRESLVLRDDDFRLSFLTGTYITLTNVFSDDIERILEQRISPLRVSLHAVSPDIRRTLIGKNHEQGMVALEALLEGGIEFDAQIVLCPGINDGEELARTLNWAYDHPGIRNVAVVPLGFTSHQSAFTASFDDPIRARAVIEALEPFQARALSERATPWVFAADEFYRNAYGEDLLEHLPDAAFYQGYPMFEDGIGIIRSSVDDMHAAYDDDSATELARICTERSIVFELIAGHAMMPYAAQMLEMSPLKDHLRVLPVRNDYFGGNVNVTGLLTGADIERTIDAHEAGDRSDLECIYLIPDVIFNADGLTLDGLRFEDIASVCGMRALRVPSNPLDCIHRLINQYA